MKISVTKISARQKRWQFTLFGVNLHLFFKSVVTNNAYLPHLFQKINSNLKVLVFE